MGERPFAYVCSPFRGDAEKNIAKAKEYCRKVFKAGYIPLAPHLHFTQFLNDNYPKERTAGMEMGLALLPQCRVLLVCGDNITEGMKTEIGHAKRLGVEVCTLENIPPIPEPGYGNDLSNLDNINIAVSLIEGMTGCRFTTGLGGVLIYPDSDAYFTVNMRDKLDFKAELHRISFDANIQTMGKPMNADGLLKFGQEVTRIQTLLTHLESREFILTPDEMTEFYDSIRLREKQKQIDASKNTVEKESVLDQIKHSRQPKAAEQQPKNKNKKHKNDPDL